MPPGIIFTTVNLVNMNMTGSHDRRQSFLKKDRMKALWRSSDTWIENMNF